MPKIACPSCAARYNVPDAKLGKRVKCAKCAQPFTLTPPADDGFEFPELEPLRRHPESAALPHVVAARPPYARDDAETCGPAMLSAYLKDVFGFFRIIASPWEALTLVVVCGICLVQVVAGYAGCLGLAAKVIITGWYLSFLLKTVQSGAARDDGLPDFSLTDGVMEDVIIPCLSFLAVRLIAAVPLIAALIFAVNDNRVESSIAVAIGLLGVATPELALMTALRLSQATPAIAAVAIPPLLIGLAAVPMMVLVVASAGIGSLARVDLMLTTIVRTLPGYIVATAIYFGSLGSAVVVGYLVENAIAESAALASVSPAPVAPAVNPAVVPASSDPNAAGDPNAAVVTVTPPTRSNIARGPVQVAGTLTGQGAATLIGVLASVFAMRAIGLYYAHFKSRFAWSWG